MNDTPNIYDKRANRVFCKKCSHLWIAFYSPMPLGDAANLLKSIRCPNCAATSKHIFLRLEQ